MGDAFKGRCTGQDAYFRKVVRPSEIQFRIGAGARAALRLLSEITMRMCTECFLPPPDAHVVKCTNCKNGRYESVGIGFVIAPIVGRTVGVVFCIVLASGSGLATNPSFFASYDQFAVVAGLALIAAVGTGLLSSGKRGTAAWRLHKQLANQGQASPVPVPVTAPAFHDVLVSPRRCTRCGAEGHSRENCGDPQLS